MGLVCQLIVNGSVSAVIKNVKWYVLRLKAMSFKEVLSRLKSYLVVKKYLKSRHSFTSPDPQLERVSPDWWKLSSLAGEDLSEYEALLDEAENYLRGDYNFLNITCREPSLNWHLDPQNNKLAPLMFALDLNYRDVGLVGNVKNIWEKNRHHHLTVMSAAYALSQEEKYAFAVAEQLQDWIAKNPFPLGVNWSSSLELGIRLISWVWIDRLLRGSEVHELLFGESGVLWPSIYWHQWLISKHYSHGSSANNHLIGEIAGLFISSCHWPVFPLSKRWQSLSWNILEQEISRQTFPSGLNREQAFSYHIFTTEFFLLAGIEAEMHQIAISDQYKSLVQSMLEVIPPLTDVGGNLPRYGDGDEGMVLQIRPHQSSRTDWLFRLGRQWLCAKVPLPDRNSGYLAASLVNFPAKDTVGKISLPNSSFAFSDAGLYVLAQNRGKPQEIVCLADAGDLGFLSIAAHSHADALAFTLSVGGVPIIVDPGTYVYHTDNHWRNYFRSTKAHNTITIDDLDQSKSEGIFLWTRKAKTKVLDWKKTDDGGVLTAEHDGYTCMNEGIIHRRQITLNQQGLEILDRLQGKGVHHIEWRLHFSPQCSVTLQEECCLVKWHSGLLAIYLDRQIQWNLLQGETDGGWYSSGFNIKQPTATLVGSTEIKGSIVLKNSLDLLKHNFSRKIKVADYVAY